MSGAGGAAAAAAANGAAAEDAEDDARLDDGSGAVVRNAVPQKLAGRMTRGYFASSDAKVVASIDFG